MEDGEEEAGFSIAAFILSSKKDIFLFNAICLESLTVALAFWNHLAFINLFVFTVNFFFCVLVIVIIKN